MTVGAGILAGALATGLFTAVAQGFSGFISAIALGLFGCVGVLGVLLVSSRVLRLWRQRRRAALAAPARSWLLELATFDEARVASALSHIGAMDQRHWMAIQPTVVSLLGKVTGELQSSLARLFDERGVTARALRDVRAAGRFRQIRRARAAALLGDLGHSGACPALCALLADPSLAVRISAARALGRIGRAEAAGPLLGTLAGSRRVPSDIVAYALIRLGPAAQADLITAVGHAEPLVRAVAIEILGRTGAVAAAGAVIGALHADRSEDVRIRAARALGRLSVPAAMAPLLAATRSDEPLALRAAAATGLGDLGAAEAAPTLEALLSDSVYQVAHDAAGALQRLGQAGDEALLRTMGTGAEPAAVHAMEVLAMAAIEAERRPRPRARRQRAGLRGTDARL